MKYKGKINKLDKLILSDPHYKKDVWCRYQRDFEEKNNWNVSINLDEVDYMEKYEGNDYRIQGIEINVFMIIDKYNMLSKFVNIGKDSIEYSKNMDMKSTTIGMDTAQVAIGANKSANVIEKFSKEKDSEWRPSFALPTGTDGTFGEVHEFYLDDNLFAIHFDGWLSDDMGYSAEYIRKYLEDKLDVKELVQVKEEKKVEDSEVVK